MNHYLLSGETGIIIEKASDENSAKAAGARLANASKNPVALHVVIALKSAPVGGSVTMKGVFAWFYPVGGQDANAK